MNHPLPRTTLPLILLAFAGSCAAPGRAPTVEVTSAEAQAALSPSDVLAELDGGNRRFAAGDTTPRDHVGEVRATAKGQHPKAAVLSCLDSRVVPELVFDQGLGDLFVGRIAGNFVDEDLLGSLEFATAVSGARLVVVLGHTDCGAIKGAADGVELGNLTAMLRRFDRALEDAAAVASGERSSKNKAFVEAAIEANVRRTMEDVRQRSPVMAQRIERGELAVVGGVYDLATGRVRWL